MTSPLRVYLGHGASGGPETMAPYVEGLRARGFDAHAVRLPRGSAERALAPFLEQSGEGPGIVVGGHSFGGRVASLLAAAGHDFAGLICFSYPLHRPGHPGELRVDHWPSITVPTLVVEGDRDQFAQAGLLAASLPRLPAGRLVEIAGAGHGFKGRHLETALDAAAVFLGTLVSSG